MGRRQEFLIFVYLEAVTRLESEDAGRVAHFAQRIPEKDIPQDTVAAARELVSFFNTDSKPNDWMMAK